MDLDVDDARAGRDGIYSAKLLRWRVLGVLVLVDVGVKEGKSTLGHRIFASKTLTGTINEVVLDYSSHDTSSSGGVKWAGGLCIWILERDARSGCRGGRKLSWGQRER